MPLFSEGERVLVQLGPNIEEAVISKFAGKGGRVTVICADGNTLDVDISKLSRLPKPEPTPIATSAAASAAAVAEALSVPSLDREIDDEEASLFVLSDEWNGQIETGNPFYEAAEPYMRANPGLVFRYLGNPTVKRHGRRGYVPVIDSNGKQVEVSGMVLARIPRHIAEERVRQVSQLTDDQDAKRQSAIADQLAVAGQEAGVGAQMLDAFETAKTLRDGMPGSDFRPQK